MEAIMLISYLTHNTMFSTTSPKNKIPRSFILCVLVMMPSLLIAKSYTLENSSIKRVISVENESLVTQEITNKKAGIKLDLDSKLSDEFKLRVSKGTEFSAGDITLTSRDFKFVKALEQTKEKLSFLLVNASHGLELTVHYQLKAEDFYMRKQLNLKCNQPICIERIDVEVIKVSDAHQPYQHKAITAQAPSNWRPGLGQPLFTTSSATFWGVEFPASVNLVKEHTIHCGYLFGHKLKAGQSISSYKSVMGVSDDPAYNSDAFYAYINEIRARPLRLQTQYNTWFDYGSGVSNTTFAKSVKKVNDELVVKRGVTPLKAYVIDDGWQDSNKHSDWSDMVWKVNGKFNKDFKVSFDSVKQAKSSLGLWLSPGCNFGARGVVGTLRKQKMGALQTYMSLARTKYMDMLETRMLNLTKAGVTYFKLDGTFGHLNTREFDLNGKDRGVPTMPQLGIEDWRSDDKRLNDAKYDELKTYYLNVGSERMMEIFDKMHRVNPEVYIVISNGAYLSPWWMMHCDAVWMINAGDAAGGSDRTAELVYRDDVYHSIYETDHTHFPMNSLFNHEPKKVKSKETKETFRNYLYMNMSRGTGFVELYLKTFKLKEYDWDVLAEGLLWVEDVFPTFARSRMHGGRPKSGAVYGYTAWTQNRGYISIHNPAATAQEYTLTLDRKFGLIPGTKTYHLSSPLTNSTAGLKKTYRYGDTITLNLRSKEIRILNFDPIARDWSKLKALQSRTKEDI